jgi:hypothetical protein
MHAEGDLAFDYAGMLALARRLASLASEVEATMRSRQSLAGPAQVGFRGPYADQFATRLANEETNAANLAAALRSDADLCAGAWKKAMDEENRRRYARHYEQLSRQRNVAQMAWDHFFGTGFPPEPDKVPQPQEPLYAPTAELVSYR